MINLLIIVLRAVAALINAMIAILELIRQFMVRIFNQSLLTLSSQISACEGSYSFINNDKIASVIDD